MWQEISRLVQKGLYLDNLQDIVRLCRGQFHRAPALSGTLIFICESLSTEYDNQGIPQDRYVRIQESIQPSIIRLLEADGQSDTVFVDALNALYQEFGVLKGF